MQVNGLFTNKSIPNRRNTMKKIIIENLVKSSNEKYDDLINFFVPIKRARLVYRNFGIVIREV